MPTLVWPAACAFIASLILTPIVRDIFRIYNVVDVPDGRRKTHSHPVPRVGGIAIAVSYLLALLLYPAWSGQATPLALLLLPSASVIFVIGLIDDFVGLNPWAKLAGQAVAALMAYSAGVRITNVAGHAANEWVTIAITFAWLLACTNAFNLIDGLDGLAAGIGLLSAVTMFVGALIQDNAALSMATLPLAGCLLAFLCYNFNPATIFLGDGGSLLIGFLLGCYGCLWSQKSLTLVGIAAPLMIVSLPLLDVLLAIVRRFLGGKPIFAADRGHIHHRLIDRGLSPRRVVLVIYGLCVVAAGFALLQSYTRNRYAASIIAAVFVSILWVGIRHLRYREFRLAGRVLGLRTFQRVLDAQMALDSFGATLQSAETPEACWAAIREHYRDLGFAAVRFQWNGAQFEDWDASVVEPQYWSIRIPFSANSYVELAHDFQSDDFRSAAAPLAEMLYRRLSERREEESRRATARAGGGA